MTKRNSFVETFHRDDGHWLPWRSRLRHDPTHHRMLLSPTSTDGDYYCYTGTARPGQTPDYGLFGNARGATVSLDVGLASGSFSRDAGYIHVFIGYNPTPDQWMTLWSKAYVRACDLVPEGVTIMAELVESDWPEALSTSNFDFVVDREYVFGHVSEFGVTHHKPWNGRDDGVFWFDNAAVTFP
jgi:hypothetical protein